MSSGAVKILLGCVKSASGVERIQVLLSASHTRIKTSVLVSLLVCPPAVSLAASTEIKQANKSERSFARALARCSPTSVRAKTNVPVSLLVCQRAS